MPYIHFNGQQYALGAGETLVGGGADVRIPLEGPDVDGVCAVLVVAQDSNVVIRKSGASAVKVNGVQLGNEPSPLIHGDKIEVAGRELFFGDDRKLGNTQYVSTVRLAEHSASLRSSGATKATTSTGGRLVSLVDGREYTVPSNGLVLGRDPTCDVVVPSSDVSRRHATIAPAAEGYTITDTSTNGLSVNGEAVSGMRVLCRGDVIHIANEDFRFYADVVGAVPRSTPAAAARVSGAMTMPPVSRTPTPVATPALRASAATATPPAEMRAAPGPRNTAAMMPPASAPISTPPPPPPLRSTPAAVTDRAPAMPPTSGAEQPPVLATLEVTSEGVLKGQRYEIRRPLVHVGRGRHNDVLIADASVSESHAKLQRRDSGWFVVDMESTNGTYVGGKRIVGEFLVDGSPDVRFGGVKFVFRPTPVGDVAGAKGGTHIIAPLRGQLAPRALTPSTPRRPSAFAMSSAIVEPRTQPFTPHKSSELGKILVALLILAAFGVALFFYFLSR